MVWQTEVVPFHPFWLDDGYARLQCEGQLTWSHSTRCWLNDQIEVIHGVNEQLISPNSVCCWFHSWCGVFHVTHGTWTELMRCCWRQCAWSETVCPAPFLPPHTFSAYDNQLPGPRQIVIMQCHFVMNLKVLIHDNWLTGYANSI